MTSTKQSRAGRVRAAAAVLAPAAFALAPNAASAAMTWGSQASVMASDLAQGNTIWTVILFAIAIVLGIIGVLGMRELGRRNGNGSAGGVIASFVAAAICAGMGGFLAMGAQSVTGAPTNVNGQAQLLQIQ